MRVSGFRVQGSGFRVFSTLGGSLVKVGRHLATQGMQYRGLGFRDHKGIVELYQHVLRKPKALNPNMSHSLNSLKGSYLGDYRVQGLGIYRGFYRGLG